MYEKECWSIIVFCCWCGVLDVDVVDGFENIGVICYLGDWFGCFVLCVVLDCYGCGLCWLIGELVIYVGLYWGWWWVGVIEIWVIWFCGVDMWDCWRLGNGGYWKGYWFGVWIRLCGND